MVQKVLKEPLIHFGILGIFFFALFSFLNPEESNNKIIIDEYDINEIVSKWKLQWQREPSPQELKGLLDNYIKQEIYYREALEMNLDHNDEVIRRRLAQKMQFLTQDLVESTTPSDEELEAFMKGKPEKYKTEPRFTFRHLYFSPDKRENPKQDAEKALSNPEKQYDILPVKSSFEAVEISKVRAELGETFSKTLLEMQESPEWQGPVESGFGFHLVLLDVVKPGVPLALNQVKDRVVNDYQYDLQQRVNDELFEGLLEKYEVILDINEKLIESEGL